MLAEFIEEIAVAAALDAKARNLALTVTPVEYGVFIEADRQLLASAVSILPAQLLAWKLAVERGRPPGSYIRASKVTTRE